jgi:hypothetical protein
MYSRGSWAIIVPIIMLLHCSDNPGQGVGGAGDAEHADGTVDTKPTPDSSLPDLPLSLKPVIAKMTPSDGFADGGAQGYTTVVLYGKHFVKESVVYLDGGAGGIFSNMLVTPPMTIIVSLPPNPYGAPKYDKPYKASVSVGANGMISDPLSFQYTVSRPMGAMFKGSVITLASQASPDSPSPPIEGQIYLQGATEITAGDTNKIRAEVGFGPAGKDPSRDGGWRWNSAKFVKDDGTHDVYAGPVTAPYTNNYDVAYRFSTDGGQTYVYADTDEMDPEYDASKAAKLTVQ